MELFDNKLISYRFVEYDSTLALVLNLAFCDFVYCSISLPIFVAEFLSQKPVLNQNLCIFTGALRNIIINADWMTVGIIAFFRCIRLTKLCYLEKFGKHFIIGIWIYAVAVFSTLLTYVSMYLWTRCLFNSMAHL